MVDREKVIRGLEFCTYDGTDYLDCEYNCPYTDKYEGLENTCVDALMRDAFALLKAQEPVEPVFNAMVETDMSYWVCGACGAFIYGNAYPHMAKDNMPKYCGYCGRAVKWE